MVPSLNSPLSFARSQEYDDMYNSLKRRSHKLREALNSMPNTTCTEIDGALYAFPKVNSASAHTILKFP
jgi:aspartate/methionine/tyrosine aminotransferase